MTPLENDLLTYLQSIEKPENIEEIKSQKQFSEVTDKEIAEALMQLKSKARIQKSLKKGKFCFIANQNDDIIVNTAIDLLSALQKAFSEFL